MRYMEREMATDPQPLIPAGAFGDKPSMGDPDFVDGQVRAMGDDVRKMLFEGGGNPQDEVKPLIIKWADQFWSGNDAYQQTFSPEAQFIWLQKHGLGADERFDTDPKGPITCLVAETVKRLVSAITDHVNAQIDDEQLQFRIDVAIEDCVAMLLGVENPAD